MEDLQELYQELILDHGRKPRNFHAVEHANCSADGFNPLCGDKITLQLVCNGDVIEDVGFQGSGCAISQASASTMTQAIKGRTRQEVSELSERFQALVRGEGEPDLEALGKLAAFRGVAQFPTRVKCATLAWHTLHAALKGENEITTE